MPRSPGQSLLNQDVPDGTELTIHIERHALRDFDDWTIRVTYRYGDDESPHQVHILQHRGRYLPKSLVRHALASVLNTMK